MTRMMPAVPSSMHWQPAYGGEGFATAYDDLRQSVRTILTTRLGSDPLRPDFGSRLPDYLDWPIDRARPHIVRETVAAIRRWEPRASIKRVIVRQADGDAAGVVVQAHIVAADGTEIETEVWP